MDQATAVSHSRPTVTRFSTGEWPEPERRDKLRDIYGHNIMRLDVEPLRDRPLNIEARFRTLPGLGLAYVTTSATRVRRAQQHLVNDDLVFNVSLSGGRTLCQRGREAVVADGEAILTTCAETSTTDISQSRFITLRLPRKPIATLVAGLDDCVARPIRRDTEALRLLVDYVNIFQDEHMLAKPELSQLAVRHVHELVALVLEASWDGAQAATLRGANAARLRAVKADISDNLGCSDLSIAAVAQRRRLPVRYVQRLFEAEGTTFTDFVLSERLSRAHRMLTDLRFADRPVSTIAFAAGFHHLSYFNRTFRARFGLAPSDARAQARRDS